VVIALGAGGLWMLKRGGQEPAARTAAGPGSPGAAPEPPAPDRPWSRRRPDPAGHAGSPTIAVSVEKHAAGGARGETATTDALLA